MRAPSHPTHACRSDLGASIAEEPCEATGDARVLDAPSPSHAFPAAAAARPSPRSPAAAIGKTDNRRKPARSMGMLRHPPPSWSSPRSERLTAPMPSRPCVDPSEPLTRPAAASYGLSAPSPPPVPAPHAKPREESASSALGAPSLRGLGTAPPKPHIIFYMVLSIDNPHFNPLLNCYLAIFAPFHPFSPLFRPFRGKNPRFRTLRRKPLLSAKPPGQSSF